MGKQYHKVTPPFISFSELTMKNRRNLLVSSSILLFICYFDISINKLNASGFYMSLTQKEIKVGLAFVVVYFLVSFLWHVIDERDVWGFKFAKAEEYTESLALALINDDIDLECELFGRRPTPITEFNIEIKNKIIFLKQAEENQDNVTIQRYFDEVETSLKRVYSNDLSRIERFESRFDNYSKWKLRRYKILEVGFPIIIGVISLAWYLSSFLIVFSDSLKLAS